MDIASGLDRERYTPIVVAPGAGPLASWAAGQGLEVVTIAAGDWSGRIGLIKRAAAITLAARLRNVDLIHAMAPTCYRAAGLAGALLRLPRVCHLGFPPEHGELEYSFRFGPEVVVACYDGQARDVRPTVQRVRPGCRVVSIPNGINTQLFTPAPVAPDTHRQLRNGFRYVVLIVGHLNDVKGYPTFVRAAARIASELPDCLFLSLGGETTGPGQRARYEQLARDVGIADRTRFLGFRSDVADVLRAADVVVLPSLDEGLPLAVLEAMACAKPVVATPVGGIPEAVSDGVTGVHVPPNNVESLASAVVRILSDHDAALLMGVRGRQRVESRFSVRRMVGDVEKLYGELLGSRVDNGIRAVRQDA
jgi:glycosyltransferase involved in cell wall biosynthesis